MKLFSCTLDNNMFSIGVETDHGPINLTAALEIYQKAKGDKNPAHVPFLQMLVELGYCSGSAIQSVLSEPWVASKIKELLLPDTAVIQPPIQRPSKIICLGRNYTAHAKELEHQVPDVPLFFCKAPSSVTGHNMEIVIPAWLDTRVDHEAELGIIIGRQGKNIHEDDAFSYIAGYTIVNDITARDMQKQDISAGDPWFRSKSIDTFLPTGPYIVPSDVLTDPGNCEISLTVNGDIRQQSNTSSMIFKVPEIVADISRYMTLEPGDIIATGTPEGVGPIVPGDAVEVKIQGIGTLYNTVAKEGQ